MVWYVYGMAWCSMRLTILGKIVWCGMIYLVWYGILYIGIVYYVTTPNNTGNDIDYW